MELHFYTTFFNVTLLSEGEVIRVWTKENANPYDVHISLDINKYTFYELNEGEFEVSVI